MTLIVLIIIKKLVFVEHLVCVRHLYTTHYSNVFYILNIKLQQHFVVVLLLILLYSIHRYGPRETLNKELPKGYTIYEWHSQHLNLGSLFLLRKFSNILKIWNEHPCAYYLDSKLLIFCLICLIYIFIFVSFGPMWKQFADIDNSMLKLNIS